MNKLWTTMAFPLGLLFGQGPVVQPPVVKVPPGTVTVDGSVTPNAIPDVTALRLVFGSFGKPAQASGPSGPVFSLTARQQTKIGRLKLTDADTAAFLSQVLAWHTQLEALTGTATPGSVGPGPVTNPVTPVGNPVNLDAFTRPFLASAQSSMTPAGWAAVYAYVVGEKAHMTTWVTTPQH